MENILLLDSMVNIRVKGDDNIIRDVPTAQFYMFNDVKYFNTNVEYSFPVNEQVNGGSVTIIRCTIKKDSEMNDGYAAVRQFIAEVLKMDVVDVCVAMNFPEVLTNMEAYASIN